MSHQSMGVHGGNMHAHGCWRTWDTSTHSAQRAVQMAVPTWEHFSPISSPDPPNRQHGHLSPPTTPLYVLPGGWGEGLGGPCWVLRDSCSPPSHSPPSSPRHSVPCCPPDCSSPTGNSSRHQVYFQHGSVSHFRIGKKENRFFFFLKTK